MELRIDERVKDMIIAAMKQLKQSARKKNQASMGTEAMALRVSGAMLYQPSYDAIYGGSLFHSLQL